MEGGKGGGGVLERRGVGSWAAGTHSVRREIPERASVPVQVHYLRSTQNFGAHQGSAALANTAVLRSSWART